MSASIRPDAPASQRARGPSPRYVVAREIARALGAGALLPLRTAGYLASRSALAAELSAALEAPAQVATTPVLGALPERALRIFVACAETSGETHACSLVAALRARVHASGGPPPLFTGFGGTRLAAAGVELLGAPVERASMGLSDPLANIGYYADLLRRCAEHLRTHGADVCAPVDSPALHVPLARIARAYGVPVAHFVTPQYWGWAPWRVYGYRDAVDVALTILPFEPAWFARRGVHTTHVGHPLLDALAGIPDTSAGEGAREIVVLPGSRRPVIERNLPWMLAVCAAARTTIGDLEVVVAHESRALAGELERAIAASPAASFARAAVGDLHGVLARARAALSVSGTVLLDLLHHRVPAVVVYRLENRRSEWMSRHLLTVPWFSSVNLLAGRAVYPEFCFAGEGPRAAVAAALVRAHGDADWRAQCRAGLDLARDRLGPPGAANRAAAAVLALATRSRAGA